MEIKIKRNNYKHLIQCIYLGNLVINEYRKSNEEVKEYQDFIKDIFIQIIKALPKPETNLEFSKILYTPNDDMLLCDLSDKIYDSVTEYYTEYRKSVFCEMLAEIIANKNYPIVKSDFSDSLDNLLASNLYFELLKADINLVTISANKIDRHVDRAKKELSK